LWVIINEHHNYLADQVRLSAFQRALDEVAKPGDVVLDLGAGTAIMGLLACRAGAKQVYSIDENAMIEVARKVCQANGFQDRMTFIKALSTQVDLPEKVDVLIADQIGYFGFEAGILQYFSDARERFLKPDGKMIPSRIDLCVAPIECAEGWADVEFWNNSPVGFNFSPVRTIAANIGYPVKFRPDQLLGDPATAYSLDLSFATAAPFKLAASIAATRPGTLHGIGGWFSAQLSPGVTMSNSPLAPQPINRMNVFFPIDRPVSIDEGDRVDISMHIMPADMVVTWRVEVRAAARTEDGQSSSISKGQFAHSTWKGMLICKEDLERTRRDSTPKLTPRGEARLSVLKLCDGQRALSEIEQEVYRRHPSLFRSVNEAAVFVAEVVTRYSM
jgi:Ribosomal protein L11 methyltransferase (PrmA)